MATNTPYQTASIPFLILVFRSFRGMEEKKQKKTLSIPYALLLGAETPMPFRKVDFVFMPAHKYLQTLVTPIV